MPRKAKASAKPSASKPQAPTSPLTKPATQTLTSRWPWSTPTTIEDALKDDNDNVSVEAEDRDPFTGMRIYKSPRKSPGGALLASPIAAAKRSTPTKARRSLNFDEKPAGERDEEESSVKQEKKKQRKNSVSNGTRKESSVDDEAKEKNEIATTKKSKAAAKQQRNAKANEEIEAQKKYFTELDMTEKLDEVDSGTFFSSPPLPPPKLGSRSPTQKTSSISPQKRDEQLRKRFPNARADYETYASVMKEAGVSDLMTFSEFIDAGADLAAILHEDAPVRAPKKSPVKSESPRKSAASKTTATPTKATSTAPVATKKEPESPKDEEKGKKSKRAAAGAKAKAKAPAKSKKGAKNK